MPGFKVVAVAIEGLRHRLFPLRQVEASEFTALVSFDDKNGEPMEPPAAPIRFFRALCKIWRGPVAASPGSRFSKVRLVGSGSRS